jgi:hypothetical protein
MTTQVSCFDILPQDVWTYMLTFPDYPDLFPFISTCKRAQALWKNIRDSVDQEHFSRVKIFDRANWKDYWNAGITDRIDILFLRAFLKTYWRPIPKELGKKGRVKDHCLLPTVKPLEVTFKGKISNYCLNVLENLSKMPLKGYSAKYSHESAARKQYGAEKTDKAELILLLKGIFKRGKSWKKQVQFLQKLKAKCGCVAEPDNLSQTTVVLAHHAVTGERWLGDDTGMEGQATFGRTHELVLISNSELYRRSKRKRQMISGNFHSHTNSFFPLTMAVCNSEEDSEDEGIVVMWKFPLKV